MEKGINYEQLANYLCGDTSEEAKKAHETYCEAYDKAHDTENEDNQTV